MELVSRARQAGFDVTIADLMEDLTFSGIEKTLALAQLQGDEC